MCVCVSEGVCVQGKHSRKERRQLKDKKLSSRLPTPPSYAIRGSPSYESYGDHRYAVRNITLL